jgi:hypothetical protein
MRALGKALSLCFANGNTASTVNHYIIPGLQKMLASSQDENQHFRGLQPAITARSPQTSHLSDSSIVGEMGHRMLIPRIRMARPRVRHDRR